jgi:polysaccharide pyruvyl transferase WcaK-like protein
MATSPIRIGLLWHSANSGNLGVGALTIANMRIVREVAEELGLGVRFTIIGMRDGEQAYLSSADAQTFVVTSRSLVSPSEYWALLGRLDCVLDIGAGDSFAEIYGPKRFGFLWLTKMLAVARRTPLLLSPQTIGPFTGAAYRLLAKAALERAHSVVARDEKSFDALARLAPRARRVLATDVAFALPFEDRKAERVPGRRRIGINVSGLLLADAESGRNQFGLGYDYAALTRTLIRECLSLPNADVHIFAHAVSSRMKEDDDDQACDRIAAEFPQARRAPSFPGPVEAKSYMSGLDFVVAGRMHACIGALSAGVPMVPIAYSRKFAGLFGSLGYSWLVPVTGMNADQAAAYVLDCISRREELADDAAKSMARVSSLLDAYRAELRSLFEAVVR